MSKKLFSVILVLCLLLSVCISVVACGEDESENVDDTINFYLWNADGKMPIGFQEVLDKYNNEIAPQIGGMKVDFKFEASQDTYRQELNLYFSSGSQTYDVVFDAQWIFLESFSLRGYYHDLESYFSNASYPGLQKAFTKEFVDNNNYNNGLYGIPITESFGDIGVTYIRKDWRVMCANDTDWTKHADLSSGNVAAADLLDGIDNFEEYEYYLYWLSDNAGVGTIPDNVVPIICDNTGEYGAYDIISTRNLPSKLPADNYNNGVKTDIRIGSTLKGSAYFDERTGEVFAANVDYLSPSAPDGLSSFPAGFNSADNSWEDNYKIARRWYDQGLVGDIASEKEAYAKFKAGVGGSVLQSIGNFNELEASLKLVEPTAELEIFVHDATIREKKLGAQATDYRAWNYLAIPKYVSTEKVDKIMKFFDWLFASRENHDLFQYGIKGVHWDEAKDASGNVIPNTVTTMGMQPYMFTAYLLTWNPTYIRYTSASDPKVMEYSQYMYNLERYSPVLYADFVFATVGRSEALDTALNNPSISTAHSMATAFKQGIKEDPVGNWQNHLNNMQNDSNLQNALRIIQQDLIAQLEEYISKLED